MFHLPTDAAPRFFRNQTPLSSEELVEIPVREHAESVLKRHCIKGTYLNWEVQVVGSVDRLKKSREEKPALYLQAERTGFEPMICAILVQSSTN